MFLRKKLKNVCDHRFLKKSRKTENFTNYWFKTLTAISTYHFDVYVAGSVVNLVFSLVKHKNVYIRSFTRQDKV